MDALALIHQLEGAPAWMLSGLRSVPEELREGRPSADEWSPTEIVRHVLASDVISSPRVFQILVRPGAPLPAFDERAWAVVTTRAAVDIVKRVEAFRVRRFEFVGVLRSLSEEEWTLTGEHEHRGTLTIARICSDLVEHEKNHQRQLAGAVVALEGRGSSET